MRAEELDLVRQTGLLANLSEEHLSELLHGAFLQRFPAHVDLIHQGDPADFLHIVLEGQVEIFGSFRERETTVSVLGPGDCFILAAVILDKRYLKAARTLTSSRILMVPAQATRRIFDIDASFARSITHELAKAYRSVVKELKNQKLRSGLERLAAWLLRYNVENGLSGEFDLPFDKKVLASRLGMAPEVLSRSFVTLQAYGVRVTGPHISLTDMPALIKLATPDPMIDDPKS